MKIIDHPSDSQLNKIQDYLADDSNVGIIDIWVTISPVYFLAVDSGKEVGVISISVGEKIAEIHKLYTPPEYRDRGIASRLVNHAIQYLLDNDIDKIAIESVGDSADFWNKTISDLTTNNFGFESLSEKQGYILIPKG